MSLCYGRKLMSLLLLVVTIWPDLFWPISFHVASWLLWQKYLICNLFLTQVIIEFDLAIIQYQ